MAEWTFVRAPDGRVIPLHHGEKSPEQDWWSADVTASLVRNFRASHAGADVECDYLLLWLKSPAGKASFKKVEEAPKKAPAKKAPAKLEVKDPVKKTKTVLPKAKVEKKPAQDTDASLKKLAAMLTSDKMYSNTLDHESWVVPPTPEYAPMYKTLMNQWGAPKYYDYGYNNHALNVTVSLDDGVNEVHHKYALYKDHVDMNTVKDVAAGLAEYLFKGITINSSQHF